MTIKAILFDVYGTLLDTASVAMLADGLFPGQGRALAALWRDKQLQYTWLRTLSNRYADFEQVTADALDYALEAMGLSTDAAGRSSLLGKYARLSAFADAATALVLLGDKRPLAVLSNGTQRMLDTALTQARLRDSFTALLSVDNVRAYKTSPAAYRVAVDHFKAEPKELLLVSSNGWDVAGATAFGLTTYWVNRTGAPVERLGVTPTGIGKTLMDLPDWLARQV